MNLATFRLRVQRTVGLASGTAGDEQTLVDGWVNEAVVQFLMKTKIKKRTASLTLTADVGDYVIDSDILAFEDAYVDPANGSDDYDLTPVDSSEIRRMRRFETSITGPPGYIAYEGQSIMLYPSPESSSDTLHIVYVSRPSSVLAATGDDPSDVAFGGIPAEYHPTLEEYVLWKAARYSDHAPSQYGELFKQEYERGLIQSRIAESRKGGVRIGRALVLPRRRMARSPGVDTGH